MTHCVTKLKDSQCLPKAQTVVQSLISDYDRRMRKFASLCLALLAFSACTKKPEAPSASSASQKAARTLNLAIWSNYLSPETLQEFTQKTGIQVQVSNYSSNEELQAKLQAGGSGYDVAIPSDYMVYAMIQLGLLEPLDKTKIPNQKNLDPTFLGRPFDKDNKYSLPINWGTTGIARNKKLYAGPLKGWKDLLTRSELKGKFTLLDDAREALGTALKAQGLSLNTHSQADIDKAKAMLLEARSRVRGFNSETKMPLIQGEIAVAQAYSSDALQAAEATHGDVEYIIPEEGATLWLDNLVIPKGAPHAAEAHEFINFLYTPDVAKRTVTTLWLASANREAIALLPEAFKNNPALFPPESTRKRLEEMMDLGEASVLFDRAWTEVKAANK